MTFPLNPQVGDTHGPFIWDGKEWVCGKPVNGGGNGGTSGIEEAPTDGEMYVRQNAAWSVLPEASNQGVTDGSEAATGTIGELLTFQSAITEEFEPVTFAVPAGDWDLHYRLDLQAVNGGGTTSQVISFAHDSTVFDQTEIMPETTLTSYSHFFRLNMDTDFDLTIGPVNPSGTWFGTMRVVARRAR